MDRKGKKFLAASLRNLAAVAIICTSLPTETAAADSVSLMGAFSLRVLKPQYSSYCPSGMANECGVIELEGLGKADWAYTYGDLFEPTGQRSCFNVDGTFTITLHDSALSTISGPLMGVFCSRLADVAHAHAGMISYGNPFSEDDTIQFSDGTGQFNHVHGLAVFHQFSAGAVFQGTLNGTLN